MKQPTKKQVRDASKRCPDAKNILEELYPEAFEDDEGEGIEVEETEKWREIPHAELNYISRSNSGGCYFVIEDKDGKEMFCMDYFCGATDIYGRGTVEVRILNNNPALWKIMPKDEMSSICNFRIFEKV